MFPCTALGVDSTREAARLIDLFDQTCLLHAGDAQGLREASRGMHAMTGEAAAHLLVRPGTVYDASTKDGHLAVLSFDDGMCGTVADDVDAGSLLADFAAEMKRRAITVSAIGSAPSGAAQPYRLEGAGVHLSLMMDMQTVDGRTQASMLATTDGG